MLRLATAPGAMRTILNRDGSAVAQVREGHPEGVDMAIEAVGTPGTFDICQDIVAAGGHLANIGVHGKPVSLKIDKLWSHNFTLRTRLVDTVTTPMLLKTDGCVRRIRQRGAPESDQGAAGSRLRSGFP